MDTKFTPGPWSVITENDSPIDISVDGSDADSEQVVSQWVVVESETHAGFAAAVIDMNYRNSFDDDLLNANARLISASPALYEALSDFMENPAFQVQVGGNPTAVQAMMGRAFAALAQVRGDAA